MSTKDLMNEFGDDRLTPADRELEAAMRAVRPARPTASRDALIFEAGRRARGGGRSREGPGKLVTAVAAIAQLPQAKKFLVDDGMPAASVESMEPYQAIACYWARDYERTIQDLSKWCLLPYADARVGLQRTEAEFAEGTRQGLGSPIARTLVPSVSRALFTVAKLDRQIAALRCVEAIRDYAASHDGKAPAALEAITEVPIPTDPVTAKPFKYEPTERGFVLEGTTIGLPGDVLRYEVKFVN